ncbi:MAG: helix-hairpin-helix domain-containing protein, partial [Sedimentisphaerales bacterium]|nr:helix-hairpin-helix domain-containing protein [Sedimentisphaerales bacterium]
DVNGAPGAYYGFERPCIYISELAHKFLMLDPSGFPAGTPLSFLRRKSYAIELHKPYGADEYPLAAGDWRLNIDPYGIVDIEWSGSEGFQVVLFEANDVNLGDEINFTDLDPNLAGVPQRFALMPNTTVFEPLTNILLERQVGSTGDWITVDSVTVPDANGSWLSYDENSHSVQRDITRHKCIRRLWDSGESVPVRLGEYNIYTEPNDTIYIQAHPENRPFRNVGEIGKLFRADVYRRNWDPNDRERDVRLDLADPNYHGLFQYLTVMDPTNDDIDNDGDGVGLGGEIDPSELKVPGRININTAPWFVISQLPWMQPKIAQAIVAYRDKLSIDPNGPDYKNNTRQQETGIDGLREDEGFASTGELATVINKSGYDEYSMHYYALPDGQPDDLDNYPDLTANDGALDDFEEHDVIFSRISDLVTVRSDVFSAYILVRVGVDGPQKRAMAILDRSNVYPLGGRVRVIAIQPASDPR